MRLDPLCQPLDPCVTLRCMASDEDRDSTAVEHGTRDEPGVFHMDDGALIMCCLCFDGVKREDLWRDEEGVPWNVCIDCKMHEDREVRRREKARSSRQADGK